MTLAPIVLFVYNRPSHVRQTIEKLQKNILAKESELFIYSDGPKNENDTHKAAEVRKYIRKINGFKKITITERDQNLGLAKSIITGVTEIVDRYGKIIVLEDDLTSSPVLLNFLNDGLEFYQDVMKIYCITGYNYPPSAMKIPHGYSQEIYLCPRNGSWGWATWKDRWHKADWNMADYPRFIKDKQMQKKFNYGGDDLTHMLKEQMEGKINSWAIRWCYTLFKNEGYCIYPVHSFIDNIGFDGTGVHCGVDRENRLKNFVLNQERKVNFLHDIEINEDLMKQFQGVFKGENCLHRIGSSVIRRCAKYLHPRKQKISENYPH